MKRKRVPPDLRIKIWSMPCAICGSFNDVNIDHIIPVLFGGETTEDNLQPLCRYHNAKKGGFCKKLKRPLSNNEVEYLCNYYNKNASEYVKLKRNEPWDIELKIGMKTLNEIEQGNGNDLIGFPFQTSKVPVIEK